MSPERKPEIEKKHVEPQIDVICGPMFSGKSDELIRRLNRLPHAGFKVQAFYPERDTRREEGTINSQSKAVFPATPLSSSLELLSKLNDDTDVVGIDEAQFFDERLVDVCEYLVDTLGKQVIVAGLDKNFRGEPFGPMAVLKQNADHTDDMHAFCAVCGELASRTQRIKIVDGVRQPADYNDPLILVGADEAYEARCRKHHEVPGKPEAKLFNDE